MRKKEDLEHLPGVLPWVAGVAALVLVMAYVWTFHALPANENPPAWGTFGDSVGGLLNPLVSTFTLIVAVKVWRQQKTELADTKEALKEQAKTAEQQRQEQRFFDLLNVCYRTVESIQIDMPPVRKFDTMLAVNDRLGTAAIHTCSEQHGLFAHIADCDLRALLQIHIPAVLVDPMSTHPLTQHEKV